jgi:predicted chitinase
MRESASLEEAPIKLEMHKKIARLAYSYWEAAGCPSGSAEQDWLRAERHLDGGQSDAEAHGTAPAPYFALR